MQGFGYPVWVLSLGRLLGANCVSHAGILITSALGSAMEPEDASASDARFLDKGFSEPYVPVQVQGVLFSRHFFLIRNVSRLTSLFFLRLISDSLPLSMFLSDLMKTTILLLAKNPPNKY